VRRETGHNSIYDDDCGVWSSSNNRSVFHPYVANDDGNLTRVFWIASKAAYCQERKIDGKRQYLALDPQPASESVVCVNCQALLCHACSQQQLPTPYHAVVEYAICWRRPSERRRCGVFRHSHVCRRSAWQYEASRIGSRLRTHTRRHYGHSSRTQC